MHIVRCYKAVPNSITFCFLNKYLNPKTYLLRRHQINQKNNRNVSITNMSKYNKKSCLSNCTEGPTTITTPTTRHVSYSLTNLNKRHRDSSDTRIIVSGRSNEQSK